MRRLVHAELVRIATTRTSLLTLAAALALVPVLVLFGLSLAGEPGRAPLGTAAGVRAVLSAAGAGAAALTVLGTLAMAGETRHGTATATFLVVPRRARVVVAKALATAAVGLAVGIASALLALAVGVPAIAGRSDDAPLRPGVIGPVLLGAVVAAVLAGPLGVGIGALVRSQSAAIALPIAWAFAVETLVASVAPDVGRLLPGAAINAVTATPAAAGTLVPAWVGGALLLAYAAAFLGSGVRAVVRRDVA